MNRPTIVLAEDHPNVAEQLRKLLSASFDVVAVVGHGEALVKTALRLKPDIVVTDISMPGMDGIRAGQELAQQMPSLGIVFVTVHDDPALARKALAIGRGYVLKTSAGEELVDAVFAVLDSRRFVSASLGPLELILDGGARPTQPDRA
ncbi:MAG TPA: response regulator transcription factor [Rhodanobacteraceae bacterium]|nr:response regulator transcription factor [Rhodanobacteraceae bacterium]